MYLLHNIRGTFVLPCEKTSDSSKNYHETDIFKIQDFMTDNIFVAVFFTRSMSFNRNSLCSTSSQFIPIIARGGLNVYIVYSRGEIRPILLFVALVIASTESSTATWACALNTQSSL